MLDVLTFKPALAIEVGVNGAILLQSLYYWVEKNRFNDTNFYDGEYWTYNSIDAFVKWYPFWSKRIIDNELKRLEKAGYILTGNYNTSRYDRTKWYSLTEKARMFFKVPSTRMETDFTKRGNGLHQMGKSTSPNGEMDFTERGNGFHQTVKPIPIYNQYNTNLEPNSNTQSADPTANFEELWKMYPKKCGKAKALESYQKAKTNGVADETIAGGIKRYCEYLAKLEMEPKYIKQGDTWFSGHCWEEDYTVEVENGRGPANNTGKSQGGNVKQSAEYERDKWRNETDGWD